MVQEKDIVDAVNEAGSMMETGQLSNRFNCLIGSSKVHRKFTKMVSAITERKKFVGGGNTVWCVVLKLQTIKKYGLEPLEIDALAGSDYMREGDTRLVHAARHGREANVAALVAEGFDVNQPERFGGTPLLIAIEARHTELVTILIDAGADVSQADNIGHTPLYLASKHGYIEIVAKLIDAGADVSQADNIGHTPLYLASKHGYIEIVAKLIDAGADVDQADDTGHTPMWVACIHGRVGVVKLLSSHRASRTFVIPWENHTAESLATIAGHHELAAWLAATRDWTLLHHLEVLTHERTRALLRAGDNIDAAAGPGGPTPRSIAQDLEAASRAVIRRAFLHGFAELLAPGIHNALLVLEAAKPWSRKTHTLFPAPARERAADLMRVGQWFKLLPNDFPIPFELWENFVMPHAVTRDYQPPAPQ